jgi:hypothetical protein
VGVPTSWGYPCSTLVWLLSPSPTETATRALGPMPHDAASHDALRRPKRFQEDPFEHGPARRRAAVRNMTHTRSGAAALLGSMLAVSFSISLVGLNQAVVATPSFSSTLGFAGPVGIHHSRSQSPSITSLCGRVPTFSVRPMGLSFPASGACLLRRRESSLRSGSLLSPRMTFLELVRHLFSSSLCLSVCPHS